MIRVGDREVRSQIIREGGNEGREVIRESGAPRVDLGDLRVDLRVLQMMREGGRGECPQNDTGVRTRGALSDDTGGRTRRVLSDETGGRLGQTRAGSQMIREEGREGRHGIREGGSDGGPGRYGRTPWIWSSGTFLPPLAKKCSRTIQQSGRGHLADDKDVR